MIRVLIVDDHPLYRDGLAGLLATIEGFAVVGTVGTVREAMEVARAECPDVVTMDLNLPDASGLDAARRLAAIEGGPRVVVLTMVDNDDSVTAALRAGARGYVLKGASQEEVAAALREVATGGLHVSGAAAARILTNGRGYGRDVTEREATILGLIANGRTNAEIAHELGVSVKTVQNHVSHILAKMQVSDRTQAAFRARGL